MAQLTWHDTPGKASSQPRKASPKNDPPAASKLALSRAEGSNPWFGFSMGLVGVIVGYIIGSF